AQLLFTSVQQAFVNLRTGRPGKLPPPLESYAERLDPAARSMIDQALSCSAVGGPATVRDQVRDFVERTGADELMITSQIWDPVARVRSLEILAETRAELATAA
ncbi:MAG: alkane 1-monooxygenase, partial [Brevundimonas sp.]|nr:alkane 1-monooxygenase [Brevundimonas sp.]